MEILKKELRVPSTLKRLVMKRTVGKKEQQGLLLTLAVIMKEPI